MRKVFANRVLVAAVVCSPMIVRYLMGLQRSVWTGDSAELVTAAYTLGIPHPTGYPIYVWLGKIFALVPVGSVALRVNVMSMVFAAGALYLTFLIVAGEVEKTWGSRPLAYIGGLTAVALLGHAQPFWERAQVAEVYSLSAFMMALFVFIFFRWLDTKQERLLLAASLFYGLGIGAHMSNGLLLPALLTIVVVTTRGLRPLGRALLLVIAGLSQYIFVLVRSAIAAPYIHPDAWFFGGSTGARPGGPLYNWLWFITGGRWHGETTFSAGAALDKAWRLLGGIPAVFGPVGACLVAFGLVFCLMRLKPRAKAALLLAIVICDFLYFCSYRPASAGMVLPFFAALAVFAGIGICALGHVLSKASRAVGLKRGVTFGVTGALAALVVVTCVWRPAVDYSGRDGPSTLVFNMIRNLPPGSKVDGLRWKYGKIVEYYEIVEGATVPFESGRCDLNRIPDGTCYAIDTVTDRYERMGFGLELEADVEGAPRLFLLLPHAK